MSVAAVLFAAGRGHRLLPLTDEVAKPALPLLDVPLAAFGLRRLFEGAPAVVLNVRHLPRSVTSATAPFVPPGSRLDTLHESPEAYGTAGTLVALRDRLAPTFVTWNSDLLTGRVEPGATVERSIVWRDEVVPADAVVRDADRFGGLSVVGKQPL